MIPLGYMRIDRRTFYLNGGFANPRCVRITRNKRWIYLYRAKA